MISHVVDDEPFKIKVKYIWQGSPTYIFEPKDNMLLQISTNWGQLIIFSGLFLPVCVLMILVSVFFENSRFTPFVVCAVFLVTLINIVKTRNKNFVIREVLKPDKINNCVDKMFSALK